MPHNILYFPSGRAAKVRDHCSACDTGDFVGEVVMAYNPQSGKVELICERCYRHRQAAAARRHWRLTVRQQAAVLLEKGIAACGCGD